jgi:type II secretory pathway component GspD/PulD (secretin)
MSKFATALIALALFAGSTGSLAAAQTAKPADDTAAAKPVNAPQAHCAEETNGPERTFYLNNTFQQADANEIVAALRNMLEACDKVYLLSSQNAIVIRAGAENMALAQRLLTDLDRPKKTYRLTYTVTEMDGGKLVAKQHFAMVLASGQETQLKQGSKVPIATGSYASSSASANNPVQTQYTYIDIGMNFGATLDEFANGVRLRSDVVQSSLAEEKSGVGEQDPIVRQTELKGAAFLTPGKPLMLGSVDIPATTRHLDVEVVMEQLP